MSATDTERDTAPARYQSMADALDATDPELQGLAVEGDQGGTPAGAGAGEPVARAEGDTTEDAPTGGQEQEAAPVDWEARARELEQKLTSDAARELSAAGRLKKANEELARLKAERDDFETRLKDQNAAIDQWWQDAIAQAPDEQKAAYREAFALDQAKRQVAQERQALDLEKQQRDQQREAVRQEAERTARFYATAELDTAIEARAKAEGRDPAIYQPVRDWVNSPYLRKLFDTLPLRTGTALPGDPATWDLAAIDDVDKLRAHVVAQAEAGYAHFTRQAEERQVAQNAEAARETYQPERAVGQGVSRPQRDLAKYRNSGNIAAVLDIRDGLEPDE